MKKWEKEIFQKQIQDEKMVVYNLEKTYEKSLDEINDKIMVLQGKNQTQSVIYQLKYQKALKEQIEDIYSKMSGTFYDSIDSYLEECYEDSYYSTLYGLHQEGIPVVLPLNQELVAQAQAQNYIVLGNTLSDKLYEYTYIVADQTIKQISKGIALNESYATIASNVAKSANTTVNQAIRIVRTEGHRINNEVKMKTLDKAKNKTGADIVKQWDATIDGRTRSTHIDLDGQLREIEQPFKNSSGAKAMYPGGFGIPGEDINCRCVMLQRARWSLDKSKIEKTVGDLDGVSEDQLEAWAQKFGVTKEELIKMSNGIIEPDGSINHAIKADSYNEFKKKYKTKEKNETAKLQAQLDLAQQEYDEIKSKYASDLEWEIFSDADEFEKAEALEKQINDLQVQLGIKKATVVPPKVDDQKNETLKKATSVVSPKVDDQKLESLKKEMDDAKDELSNFGNKTYSGIWKEDVTYADYESKQGSIQKKKDYYFEQIASGNLTEAQKSQYLKYIDDLEEFESEGKKYLALKNKLDAATKDYKIASGAGVLSDAGKATARDFSSRTDADNFHRPYLDSKWDELSDREKYATWEYTRNSNPMNKSLSGYHDTWGRSDFRGLGNTDWGHEDSWRSVPAAFDRFGKNGNATYGRVITDLTKAIDKMELPDDVYLVRGSGNDGLAGLLESIMPFEDAKNLLDNGDIKSLKALIEGNTVVNHAFTSTAVASGTGFGGNVSYKIYAPRGTHGIYAEPQSYFGDTVGMRAELYKTGQRYSGVGGEAEIIIQRGTSYRIESIDYDGYKYHVRMDIVEQPSYFRYGDEETFNNGLTRHRD